MSMNARTKGSEFGWTYQIVHMRLTKEQYEKVGKVAAQRTYKRQEAQEQFLNGWLERWSEPHAKDCKCDDCEHARSMIETF